MEEYINILTMTIIGECIGDRAKDKNYIVKCVKTDESTNDNKLFKMQMDYLNTLTNKYLLYELIVKGLREMIGIYKITNSIDNTNYIGKSKDIKTRIRNKGKSSK